MPFKKLAYGMDISTELWSYSQTDTAAAAFETVNGESVLAYYNPNCVGVQTDVYAQPTICANFIYDLNGTKGPNTVGKDIGVLTVLYPSDPVVVSPQPLLRNASEGSVWTEASRACTAQDSESRLPNINELSSMFCNNKLFNMAMGVAYWSGNVDSSSTAWCHGLGVGTRTAELKSNPKPVRCVKR